MEAIKNNLEIGEKTKRTLEKGLKLAYQKKKVQFEEEKARREEEHTEDLDGDKRQRIT